jgi:hypothetical protein
MKGKTASKKKATKPIALCATQMWVKTTDGASHPVVAIAHRQKWVVGMVMSPTSPHLVASGTRKGHPATELRQATRTLLTCCGGGCGVLI